MSARDPVSPTTAVVGVAVLSVCVGLVLSYGGGSSSTPEPFPDGSGVTSEAPYMADTPLPLPTSPPLPTLPVMPTEPTGAVPASTTAPPVVVELEPDPELEREDDHHPAPTADHPDADDDTRRDGADGDRNHGRPHWWRWLT